MQSIFIIGGGASGLIASIYAKTENNQVTILEKNNIAGKKILVSGNGRCNYWNSDQKNHHYHSSNNELLSQILVEENKIEIERFFASIGIIPRIKNGYYYPFSNQAKTIQNSLVLEAFKRGVKILYDTLVEEIKPNKNHFNIITTKGDFIADKVIIATGSNAYYSGNINTYQLVESLNIPVTKVLPSLVQLVSTPEKYLQLWNKIRTEVDVSLWINDKFIKKESGEIQLTEYGISGICVFNLSRFVSLGLSEKKKCVVKINFVPFVKDNILKWLEEQNNKVQNRTIKELLEAIMNYKLVKILFDEIHLSYETKWQDLTQEEKEVLGTSLTAFSVSIVATKGFNNAQVCLGGVELKCICPKTMESAMYKNLFITGELLDVDGDCGGYNLGFAWISGMLAGKGCKNDSGKAN